MGVERCPRGWRARDHVLVWTALTYHGSYRVSNRPAAFDNVRSRALTRHAFPPYDASLFGGTDLSG